MAGPRVLIDCNVLVDLFCQRKPGLASAESVWDANQSQKIDGYLTATSVLNLSYILERTRRDEGDSASEARDQALEAVKACLKAFKVLPVGWYELDRAKNKTGDDYEDNVQIACAERAELDWIVTNDGTGFAMSTVRPVPAADYVAAGFPARKP